MRPTARTLPGRFALAAACAVLTAGLTACGDGGDVADVADQAAKPGDAAAAEPGLQGVWGIRAPGEPDGTVLELAGGDWLLARPCGSAEGTWAARGGLFLGSADTVPDADFSVGDPEALCPPAERAAPVWLDRLTGYRKDGSGWELLDSAGEAVVDLTAGGELPARYSGGRAYMEFGDGSDYPNREGRAHLNAAAAVPLPAGVRAPSPADLVGRWQLNRAEDHQCTVPYIQFAADGTWTGRGAGTEHDTGTNGRWLLGKDGLALGTGQGFGGGGCYTWEGAPEPDYDGTYVDVWMLRLARLGLDGSELVFYDPDGVELARVRRVPIPTPTPTPEPVPPPDPRAAGVPVRGGVKYLASFDEHQLDLAPRYHQTEYEMDWDGNQILGVDHSGKGAKLLTGCWGGDIWITVRSRTTAPPPLAQSMAGWEVGEEETMTVTKPLWGSDLEGYWFEKVFTPTVPGLHRVRVLAKGRAVDYDDECDKNVEEYEVTIWPVLTKEPRVRRGDDGV